MAIAEALLDHNYNVATFSSTKKKVDQIKKKFAKKKKFFVDVCNVLNDNDINEYHKSMLTNFGAIDILINNVGGGGTWGSDLIENTAFEVWNEVHKKNVATAIKLINLNLKHMKKKKWGRVITIASVSSKKNNGRPWYVMAKKGEVTLMKTLSARKDLVRSGITFNSISPGAIMIPDTGWDQRRKENPKKFKKLVSEKFPLGRLGTPKEIAAILPFLCSDESAFINGADIVVDGGQSNEEYED